MSNITLHDARPRFFTDPDVTVRVDPFADMHRMMYELLEDADVMDAIDDALGLVELIDQPGFFDTQPARPYIEVSIGALEA